MKRHRCLTMTLVTLLAGAVPQVVLGQADKLAGRFPAAAEATLRAVIDSAQREGLPTNPLVERALEGASRGVDPTRVVTVVRALRGRLVVARRALGDSVSEAELVAAASALYLGVPPDSLTELRRQHQGRSVALPLIVLADMVQQGVPRDTATGIVMSLTRARIADEDYTTLRQAVLLDIRSGMPPAAAASARARGAMLARPRDNAPGQRPRPSGPSPSP